MEKEKGISFKRIMELFFYVLSSFFFVASIVESVSDIKEFIHVYQNY